MRKKNRKTLKKRIRRVISLCIFLTVVIFGFVLTITNVYFFKVQGEFLCEQKSYHLVEEMNSSFFHKSMNIKDLTELDPSSPPVKEWMEMLKKTEVGVDIPKHATEEKLPQPTPSLDSKGDNRIMIGFSIDQQQGEFPYFTYTKITIHNKIIYQNERLKEYDLEIRENDGPIEKLYKYYSNTYAKRDLMDLQGKKIGEVIVMASSDFLLTEMSIQVLFVIVFGCISLIISNLISKLLTIPITNPLEQLNQKVQALANEEFDKCFHHQIILRRPLREIEDLAESTNVIMMKMKAYSDILNKQKQELVDKNEELEAQNDELIKSREKIEDQKLILEQQNDELEAQNIELAESKRKIEETQTQLVQSENMASIGQLTAAITHEINTPLGAIMSNVQICDMLIQMLGDIEDLKHHAQASQIVEQMKEANNISVMGCTRVTEIIKSLKTFSKIDQAEFQQVNIIECIKSVLVLTSNLWKNKIRMIEEYMEVPMVKCYPGLLNQVFMNLIINAIQAIENQGEIHIKAYSKGKDVFVSIRDTGSGIRKENLPKIFDSGYTTKSTGIGMGIGLKICQNIMKKHHGSIQVESEWGKGTEFTVVIPGNLTYGESQEEVMHPWTPDQTAGEL